MATVLNEHIQQSADIRGGRPHIVGRRITVDDVVIMHLRLDLSIDEIATKYNLTFAEIHAALAYYYDHQHDIDQQINHDEAVFDAFRGNNPSKLQEKLKALRDG